MRDQSSEFQAAVDNRLSAAHWLVWLTVRDRTSGTPASFGFWNGGVRTSILVKDGLSGAQVTRNFRPRLHGIGEIRYVSSLSVEEVEISLDNLDPTVRNAILGFTPKRAPVQIHRVQMAARSQNTQAAPAEPFFVGFIDRTPISRGPAGQAGSLRLICTGLTIELRRTNSETRSNASQHLRNPNDGFYQDTAVVGEWELFWGTEKGKAGGGDGKGGGGGGGGSAGGNIGTAKKMLKGIGLGGFLK